MSGLTGTCIDNVEYGESLRCSLRVTPDKFLEKCAARHGHAALSLSVRSPLEATKLSTQFQTISKE